MADWLGYSRVEARGPTASQPASNVPAQVDNCCFVDRQCNTPADWENGYWAYQNGQCAAPAQSQTPAQPVSNVPAQVDNCCFVDRQCNTPADWENGFYAFRDNQCGAPAPAQSQTSSQPVNSSTSQVDNCCFVDRQCNTPADWENGFYAFRDNQCQASTGGQLKVAASSQAPSGAAIPLSTSYMTEGVRRFLANPTTDPFNNCCHMRYQDKNCSGDAEWEAGFRAFQNHQCRPPAPLGTRPAIDGSAAFVNVVESALDLIAIHAPDWLNYIYNSGVHKILMLSPGGANGFFNRGWLIASEDRDWMPDHRFLAGYAGFIAHEACHAIQQRTYSQSEGWTNEAACVEAQVAVIEAIDPNSPSIYGLRNLIANIQNPKYWWW